MKYTLPISITSIPDQSTSADLWRQISPILSAIAERERSDENLYPYEKIAYSSLAYAQYHASKKQWSTLWTYLLERQVLRIDEVTPPIKPRRDGSTNPPKNKVAKLRKKKKRKSPVFIRFKRLKHSSIRLQAFLYFANFLAYIVPLCPNSKIPLRDRGCGEKIKALLSYKSTGGEYASLKLYLPSAKKKYRIHPSNLKILLDWSNPLRTRSDRKIESDKQKGLASRIISTETICSALTDKWQDTTAITAKLNAILGTSFSAQTVSKLLSNRARTKEIHQFVQGNHAVVYFSTITAIEFESAWIPLEMAFQIAVSRGFTGSKNTFRKNHKFNYAVYGLEFRKEAPEAENSLLRWRDIQSLNQESQKM